MDGGGGGGKWQPGGVFHVSDCLGDLTVVVLCRYQFFKFKCRCSIISMDSIVCPHAAAFRLFRTKSSWFR